MIDSVLIAASGRIAEAKNALAETMDRPME